MHQAPSPLSPTTIDFELHRHQSTPETALGSLSILISSFFAKRCGYSLACTSWKHAHCTHDDVEIPDDNRRLGEYEASRPMRII